MFVFKAAVLGAGTMGGEIAQVIASADVPVVMKDVKQEFIDAGLTKAREVTEGQLASLVKKEKLTQEQADERRKEILARITGTTEYDGIGDAADRGRRGGVHLRGDQPDGIQLRDADPQAPDSLRRGAGVRGQPGPEFGCLGDLALQG